jgi:hypothetical protein
VGFAGVGTPLGVTGGGGVGVVFLFDFDFFDWLRPAADCLRLTPACAVPGFSDVVFWPWAEPFVGLAGFDLTVVVGVVEEPCDGLCVEDLEGEEEVEGEVEVEVDVVLELVVDGWVVVTVAAGVVAVTGGHDCATFTIGRFTGSGSDVGGVPGGTFWKVNC